MMIFTELLSIKRYREQQAETAMQRERRLLEAARQSHEQAEQAVIEFRQYARQRETQLYGELYREPVRVSAIDYVLASVRAMQEHEATLLEEMHKTQEALDSAQARFTDARDHHKKAVRATEKFIELSQVHLNEAALEGERQEDLEMEEVASMMRDQDEWSNHEEVEIA